MEQHSLRSRTDSTNEIPTKHPAAANSSVTVKTVKHCHKAEDHINLLRSEEAFYVPYTEFHDPEIVGKVINSPNRRKRIRVEGENPSRNY